MDGVQQLDKLLRLYKNYSHVTRRTVALDKYTVADASAEPTDERVRESLLEHVGSLPVLAAYLYPLLEHKEKIDLGKVLTMLAVHDIGETEVGDEHPHNKTQDFLDSERKKALELLPDDYHPLLNEFEESRTLEAKFAKSVDVFATFLADLLLPPNVVAKRLAAYEFSSKLFFEKRYEVFAWDASLKDLFGEIIKRYQQMGL